MDYQSIKQRFIELSYNNQNEDYFHYVNNPQLLFWDYVIITASNKKQKDYFLKQIDYRFSKKLLPRQSHFFVFEDFDGMRIGSGGATLNAISELIKFDKNALEKKILLIHSGGDSKRVAQYSVCGKLFSPVPRILYGNIRSTLFDELMITTCGVCDRMKSGMLVVPGDTEFIFSSLQIDLSDADAVGLSLKESADIGKDHGVFLTDEERNVKEFLHKLSVVDLRNKGALDNDDKINLDTGYIWLSSKILNDLYDLICTNFKLDNQKFRQYVNNQTRLSFYADFLYPLGKASSLDTYLNAVPEYQLNDNLLLCRRLIWDKLSKYNLKIAQLTPSLYFHFGTTYELKNWMTAKTFEFSNLGWSQHINSNSTDPLYSTSLSVIDDSVIGKNTYIENSVVRNSVIGNDTIISNVEMKNKKIPPNVVLHTVKLNNNKFVTRIYGIYDNPKSTFDGTYLKSSIRRICNCLGVKTSFFSEKVGKTIWDAELFPECESIDESIEFALYIYNLSNGIADESLNDLFLASKRYSLSSSFANASTDYIFDWEEKIYSEILISELLESIRTNKDMNKVELKYSFDVLKKISKSIFQRLSTLDYLSQARLALFFSDVLKKSNQSICGKTSKDFENTCYAIIAENVVEEHFKKYSINKSALSPVNNVKVELPVRVNFCGSPSDAAPYCLEFGGTQFNSAILLNGKFPITVNIKKINDECIRFKSLDLNIQKDFTDLKEFLSFSDVDDQFSIYKASLMASGIADFSSFNNFSDLLLFLGTGFEIESFVDVPKGSGLGTSSLLMSAILKALDLFFGIEFNEQKNYSQVFSAEQLMTTAGGWQDQVGGLTPGLKLIRTYPGKNQFIHIDYSALSEETKDELNDRFVLLFSGQRRLAKNVLRNEMSTLFRNSVDTLEILNEIQSVCLLMKYELEKGNITRFAHFITKQFELVKKIDSGASNEFIELIFNAIDDLIDGKSICGAGGGGFLMCVLKKGHSKQELCERIKEMFQGCGVEVWDSSFYW